MYVDGGRNSSVSKGKSWRSGDALSRSETMPTGLRTEIAPSELSCNETTGVVSLVSKQAYLQKVAMEHMYVSPHALLILLLYRYNLRTNQVKVVEIQPFRTSQEVW